MSILTKRLFILMIICLIVVGCKDNEVDLPKEENKTPDEFDTQTSNGERSQVPKANENDTSPKNNDSDIISDEAPLPDKDSELPKNPIPKGKIDKGQHNNSEDNTIEEKDSPVENDDN